MSRRQLLSTIQKELLQINDRIDRKIVAGKSYADEARRHKALLRQLTLLGRKPARSGLMNFFSFL